MISAPECPLLICYDDPGVQARERERGGSRPIYFVSHAKGQRGEAATGYNTTDTRPGHSGHNNYQPHIQYYAMSGEN